MRRFMQAYMPTYHRHARLVYDGLRNALLHEYGTRGVAITDLPDNAAYHLRKRNGILVLHLESLLRDCERAYFEFERALKKKPALRAKALAAAEGLLAPVELVADPRAVSRQSFDPTEVAVVAASATSSTTVLRPDLGGTRPGS